MKNTKKIDEGKRPNQVCITLYSPRQLEIINEKAEEDECTNNRSAFLRPWMKNNTDLMKAGITSDVVSSHMKEIIALCLND